MIVETDFTSRKHTLSFETSHRRIALDKAESEELEKWFQSKIAENTAD
jgi:hypothetical protein